MTGRSLYSSPLDPLASSAPDLTTLQLNISKDLHKQGYSARINQTANSATGFKGVFECSRGLIACPFKIRVHQTRSSAHPDGERWEATAVEPDHSHPPTETTKPWKPSYQLKLKMIEAGLLESPVPSQPEPGPSAPGPAQGPTPPPTHQSPPSVVTKVQQVAPSLKTPTRPSRSTPLDPSAYSAPSINSLRSAISKDLHRMGYTIKISGTASESSRFMGKFGCTDTLKCPFKIDFRRVRGPDHPDGEWWKMIGVQPNHNHPPRNLGEWKPPVEIKTKSTKQPSLASPSAPPNPAPVPPVAPTLRSPTPPLPAEYSTPLDSTTFAGPDNLKLRIEVDKHLHARGYRAGIIAVSSGVNRHTYCPSTLYCWSRTEPRCPFVVNLHLVRGRSDPGGEWWEATTPEPNHSHPPAELGEWKPEGLIQDQMYLKGMIDIWGDPIESQSEHANEDAIPSSSSCESPEPHNTTTVPKSPPPALPRVGDTFATQTQVREAVDRFLGTLGRRLYVQQSPKLHMPTTRLVVSCYKPHKHCPFALAAVRQTKADDPAGERWQIASVKPGHGITVDGPEVGEDRFVQSTGDAERGDEGHGGGVVGQDEEAADWGPSGATRTAILPTTTPPPRMASSTSSSFDEVMDDWFEEEYRRRYGRPMPASTRATSPLAPEGRIEQAANSASGAPPTDSESTASSRPTKRRRRHSPESVSWSAVVGALNLALAPEVVASLVEGLSRPEVGATPANYFGQRVELRRRLPDVLVGSVALWPRVCLADRLEVDGERVWEELTGGRVAEGPEDE